VDILKQKVEQMASGASSRQEISRNVSDFVQDQIPYTPDEWDRNEG
jgi:hypothetical protein